MRWVTHAHSSLLALTAQRCARARPMMIPTRFPEDLGHESSHYQGLGRNSPPRSMVCSQLPHNPGPRKCHLLVRYALFVLASRAFQFFLDSQRLILRKKSLRKWASVDPPRAPRRGYKFSTDPSRGLLKQLA
ncbi:hypothetical protein BDW71DRAFT_47419 [Aspergillus fruticulosus]